MFAASQEMRLNNVSKRHTHSCDSEDIVFGKYRKTPEADLHRPHTESDRAIFIAPELTDVDKIQLLKFPSGIVRAPTEIKFQIRRNGIKGNFEIKLESPSAKISNVLHSILDMEQIEVPLSLEEDGLYKVHIKCNSVTLKKSPFIIVVINESNK